MKKIYAFITSSFLFIVCLYAQHPNRYLADVYDVTWLQENEIKELTSRGDKYIVNNGIAYSEQAKELKINTKGKTISYSLSTGKKFKFIKALTNDLKKLKYESVNGYTTNYHYDDDGVIKSKESTKPYNNGFFLEKEEVFTSNDKKQLIKKEVYKFDKPAAGAKLNYDTRDLYAVWTYTYDNQNNLVQIEIKDCRADIPRDKMADALVEIKHENRQPTNVKVKRITEEKTSTVESASFTYLR